MAFFINLPKNVIEIIALLLNPNDLFQLGSCSKSQCKQILKNQELWKQKTLHDFGDLFQLYHIFTTSTGLELPTDLTKKFAKEPENWKHYHITKYASIHKADENVLLAQSNKEYKEARKYLESFQDDINYSNLIQIASKMLWILDMFPVHAGSYYVLAYMLFIVNQIEDALDVIYMGQLVDPKFEPFKKLEQEILQILQGYKNDKDVPVLINDSLSPEILKVLLQIFHKFDKNRDDCLDPEELDLFVYSTNGQHPPTSFIEQMGERFGANEKGWLTRKGYLAFYLEQTLGDPDETRKDIRAHGYDGSKLKKIRN